RVLFRSFSFAIRAGGRIRTWSRPVQPAGSAASMAGDGFAPFFSAEGSGERLAGRESRDTDRLSDHRAGADRSLQFAALESSVCALVRDEPDLVRNHAAGASEAGGILW